MPTPTTFPFTRGQNVTLRCYQGNSPIYLATKNFKVEENATETADPVNGELRDRLDKVANHYSFSGEVYVADAILMDTIIAAQDADDAQGLPLNQGAAVFIKHRNGTQSAYAMAEAKFGPFDFNPGERSAATMITFKGRFRFWTKLPSFG